MSTTCKVNNIDKNVFQNYRIPELLNIDLYDKSDSRNKKSGNFNPYYGNSKFNTRNSTVDNNYREHNQNDQAYHPNTQYNSIDHTNRLHRTDVENFIRGSVVPFNVDPDSCENDLNCQVLPIDPKDHDNYEEYRVAKMNALNDTKNCKVSVFQALFKENEYFGKKGDHSQHLDDPGKEHENNKYTPLRKTQLDNGKQVGISNNHINDYKADPRCKRGFSNQQSRRNTDTLNIDKKVRNNTILDNWWEGWSNGKPDSCNVNQYPNKRQAEFRLNPPNGGGAIPIQGNDKRNKFHQCNVNEENQWQNNPNYFVEDIRKPMQARFEGREVKLSTKEETILNGAKWSNNKWKGNDSNNNLNHLLQVQNQNSSNLNNLLQVQI